MAVPKADTDELARFRYKQELELDRSLGLFSSFAAGFSYISIMTGVFEPFFLGFFSAGPGVDLDLADSEIWPCRAWYRFGCPARFGSLGGSPRSPRRRSLAGFRAHRHAWEPSPPGYRET
jgi:hypothetical protein